MRGVFITGTDTNVGKTYVGCLLAQDLNARGINVVPRKPAESGCIEKNGELIAEDALALKQAASYSGSLNEVCPNRFKAALSPVRAAQLENKNLSIEQLHQSCTHSIDGFTLVEGAGGFYSPLASDGLNADLAQSLQLPVLLVAEDRLGCINQILLTAEAIANRKLNLAAVVLNKINTDDHSDMNNAEDLLSYLSCPIYQISSNDSKPISALSKQLLSL